MGVLRRHREDNTICVQALMLAIGLTNTCANNRQLLTQSKYISVYGTLLGKDRQVSDQELVIEKTIRLLSKLTSDSSVIVMRFNEISTLLCEQIMTGLYDHLRTPLFGAYCKFVVNLCSHNNDHMKKAFGSRTYSLKFIEFLNVYKDDLKIFKIVANMIILMCGNVSDEDAFDGIVTEYFVSAIVSILGDTKLAGQEGMGVVEVAVIMLHKLATSHEDLAEALQEAGMDKVLRSLLCQSQSQRSDIMSSLLGVKIKLLLTLLERVEKKLEASPAPVERTGTAPTSRSRSRSRGGKKSSENSLLPQKHLLLAIHDCCQLEELLYFLQLSVREGRDSVALQTLIRLTTLAADKHNNGDLAAFLLGDTRPVLLVLQAFTVSPQVQVVGVNLLQLLSIDYSGQITPSDTRQFLNTLNTIIWGHFSSEEICEKYLDFMLLSLSAGGEVGAANKESAATVETFAALKNIMSCHMTHRNIILKSCRYTALLAISEAARSMILGADINNSIVDYMYDCGEDLDEETAGVFHDTVLALCAGQSEDQLLFFSSDESAALYLHLLQCCVRSGPVWLPVLQLLLFLAARGGSDAVYYRGMLAVNYASVLSRCLHAVRLSDQESAQLVEVVVTFLVEIISLAPALERRFVNVDTANFVTAVVSEEMQEHSVVTDKTTNACDMMAGIMQTVPVEVAAKDLAFHFIEQKRMVDSTRSGATSLLQRNVRRMMEHKSAQRELQYLEEHVAESSETDFVKKCLLRAMHRGCSSLAEAALDRVIDLLEQRAEEEEEDEGGGHSDLRAVDLPLLAHLARAPAIILEVMSSFLSLASVQFAALRVLQLLPYAAIGAEAAAGKSMKDHMDVFFLSLLRHMNDNVVCGENIDCLIFLTGLNESNIFNASTPVTYQIVSFLLKNNFEDV